MTTQDSTSVSSLNNDTAMDADKTRFAVKLKASKDSNKAATTLEPGMLIKQRYLLEHKIGSGGMSDIYRATDIFLQQAGVSNASVAIKVLQQQFVDQTEALQLLLQEAHKTQQLAHPNIVRVFDVDSDNGLYFIVMEYLDGESLEQVIKRYKPKGLPLKSALKLLQQIADALNYAHRLGIVHADLKPANIMVNRAGEVKVLDFGVAQKLQLNHDIYAAEQQSQTAPLSGYTPAYASAQLLAGNSPCVADDVFSFACLSYELLSSKHPFDRLPADKAAAAQKKAAKPAHVNVLQWQALKRGLVFDGAARSTSISGIMQQLSRPLWRPVGAAAAVALLGVGAWQYHQQQQQVLLAAEAQSAQLTAQQALYHQLSEASAAELLQAVQLPETPLLQREAVLRSQQQRLISHFEQQIDLLLSDRSFNYPNYPEIEQILAQATALYPDSHYLTDLSSSMARSKETALEVLRGQLNQLLLNRQYEPQQEGNDPYKLAAELTRIEQRYVLQPNAEEATIYRDSFNQAVASNDAVALKHLIRVGELIFANYSDTQALVSQGQQLASAVEAMAAYRQAVNDGQPAEFPYQAAELFYQHSFSLLEQELQLSAKANDVDAVYEKLQQFNAQVPADFSLHMALRRKLADKYLAMSGELLQSNQVRTAERLMRRANELMSSLNS
ncbi:serine/threonine-protein kinase [Rheinheimera fenheensis]|uniref:serine/threonine-protein kinase n=1 Tax=Rheinheimera fenheensis TaxID=3152295 RepID=UPI00325F44DE